MVNTQLVDYIKKEEAQGYTAQQLRNYLIQQGWNPAEVDEAINYVNTKKYPGVQTAAPTQYTQKPLIGIKRRSPIIVFIFCIITLGIYGVYWIVSTTNDLRRNTKSAPNPLLLLLLIVPLVNVVVMFIYFWKYSKAINELTGFSALTLFLLWVFISPVAMILSQMELNKA